MSRRKLHQLLKGEYRPRAICSTGAEEVAAAEVAADLVAADAAAGGAFDMGIGGIAESMGLSPSFTLPFGLNPASVGLQVGGTLLKGQAMADANARRQTLVNAMAAYQKGNAKKSMAVTDKFIEGATPEAREAAMAAAENENKLGYEKTVGAAQAFEQPGGVAGNVSDRYKQAQADSAEASSARTRMLIENLAKMRAPGVAGGTEARRFGQAAGEIQGFNSANRSVGGAYTTDIGNVAENPWLTMGGDVLTGTGQGMMLRDSLKKMRASAI